VTGIENNQSTFEIARRHLIGGRDGISEVITNAWLNTVVHGCPTAGPVKHLHFESFSSSRIIEPLSGGSD
jgi:hypothetical protein